MDNVEYQHKGEDRGSLYCAILNVAVDRMTEEMGTKDVQYILDAISEALNFPYLVDEEE